MRENLTRFTDVPHTQLRRNDWLGRVSDSWLFFSHVTSVSFPLIDREAKPALRVSNGVAIVMLFLTG